MAGETLPEYKVKEYPLEVERTADGDCCFSKGWHDPEEFIEAAYIELALWDKEEETLEPEYVRYQVWRVVPAQYEEFSSYFHEAQLGTPGAFPVTLVYI